MFREQYKAAESFSVPRELLERTARKMEEALEEDPLPRSSSAQTLSRLDRAKGMRPHSLKKLIPPLAAAACLVVIAGTGFFKLAFGEPGSPMPADDAGNIMYSLQNEGNASPEAIQAPMAGTGGTEEAALDGGSAMKSAAPALENGAAADTMGTPLPALDFVLNAVSASPNTPDVLLADDASNLLDTANPWTTTNSVQVTELPVYRNTCVMDSQRNPLDAASILSEQEQAAAAAGAAALCGVSLENGSRRAGGNDYAARTSEGGEIVVSADGQIYPSEYVRPTEQTTLQALPELVLQESGVFTQNAGWENAAVSLRTSYWNDTFTPVTHVTLYDRSGSLEEQIVNFNVRSVYAGALDTAGFATIAPLYCFDRSYEDEVGVYPLQTVEAAQQLLLEDDTLSDSSQITESDICAVELRYYGSPQTEYYQPAYLFYVDEDLPDEAPDSLNAYRLYWVPAVAMDYVIVDVP